MATSERRILIVEDDFGLAELISDELEKPGTVCAVAHSAREALACLASDMPQLMLLDYALPDMHADALLKELMCACRLPPFIVITGHGDEQVAVQLMKQGARDYLVKDTLLLDRLPIVVARVFEELAAEQRLAAAERARQESQEQFRIYIDRSPMAVLVATIDGRLLDGNPAAAALFGYDMPTLQHLHVHDLHPAEDHAEVAQALQELSQHGRAEGEFRMRRQDGTILWVHLRVGIVAPGRALGYCQDVTERREMEQRQEMTIKTLSRLNGPGALQDMAADVLRIIKEGYRLDAAALRIRSGEDFPYCATDGFSAEFAKQERGLCARTSDGQALRDADGRAVLECACGLVVSASTAPDHPMFTPGGSFWCNDTFPLLELSAADDPRLRPRNRCVQAGYRSLALIPIRSDQKTVGLLQLNDRRVNRFKLEDIRFFEGLAASIGGAVARRQAEYELRENEDRYRRLFNVLSDAVFIHRFDAPGMPGKFVEVNDLACRRYGYSRAEFLALQPKDIVAPEDAERVAQRSQRMLRDGEAMWEGVHQTRDGRHFPVEVSAIRFDWRGESMVLAGVRDISERRVLEERVRQAEKMDSIGRLAGGVAHDFNNMLFTISGYAQLTQDALPADSPLRDYLKEVLNASKRGAQLTRRLLTFSRKQAIEPRPLDLNVVVRGMEKMIGQLVGEDILVQTDLAEGLEVVVADAGQIEQAILNLVINARDAMSLGGVLTIATRNETLSVDYAQRTPGSGTGPHVALEVRDTGSGMAPEVQARVFEPFFTTKEIGKGTGLGLSMVFGAVKQSGGHITMQSEPGNGATFTVHLPRAGNEGASPTPPAETKPDLRGTESVMLVEDDPAVRALTTGMLASAGYRVLAMTDGQEALEAAGLRATAPDLLLTDVIMPRMNGRELAERMHAISPALKVLYMSGYTGDDVARKGIEDETANFIHKPFDRPALLRKVREALGPCR